MTKKTYSLSEIAKRWGCSDSVVLTLVYRGDLRAIDISTNQKRQSRYIVAEEEVLRFEASRTTLQAESEHPQASRDRRKGGDASRQVELLAEIALALTRIADALQRK